MVMLLYQRVTATGAKLGFLLVALSALQSVQEKTCQSGDKHEEWTNLKWWFQRPTACLWNQRILFHIGPLPSWLDGSGLVLPIASAKLSQRHGQVVTSAVRIGPFSPRDCLVAATLRSVDGPSTPRIYPGVTPSNCTSFAKQMCHHLIFQQEVTKCNL